MSSSNTVKAWYFKAGETSVKTINYNAEDRDTLKKLLDCEYVGCQTIKTSKGIFTIIFNDNGFYEDTLYNKPATLVLGKIPIWGGRELTGNYIVKCSLYYEDDTIQIDMPKITFKEWIDVCREAILKAQKISNDYYKAMGFTEVYNDGMYSVSTK
jgi:hypothetical protein